MYFFNSVNLYVTFYEVRCDVLICFICNVLIVCTGSLTYKEIHLFIKTSNMCLWSILQYCIVQFNIHMCAEDHVYSIIILSSPWNSVTHHHIKMSVKYRDNILRSFFIISKFPSEVAAAGDSRRTAEGDEGLCVCPKCWQPLLHRWKNNIIHLTSHVSSDVVCVDSWLMFLHYGSPKRLDECAK